MTKIFVFTAGNPTARAHLNHSIINPIDREKVFNSFNDSEHQKLQSIYEEGNGFYAWGAIPGPQNLSKWNAMSIGDYVLCVYENTYHYFAKVLAKYNNCTRYLFTS